MSGYISQSMAREVRQRADNLCEYCLLPQDSQEAAFHVDHIQPRSRGGETSLDNLALSCVSCSLRKAARCRVRDPRTGKLVPLFNPRSDNWTDHFALTKRWHISGCSPVGRATIEALGMNRETLIAIRRELALLGRYPPEAD
jgi:5-methylcytosine-specific restriction endonuclease McrA